ncbi:hypothetical protein [Thermomonospora cellulosilytica]|uniref:Uncharacterized protein n=1 Tax=Thermomonospora cellulosilytica TaxID=1411118 RepID=A0A7W3MXN8_9ACTN|nr:hypothetical protein [Thermomonospora cellulosilytica]MBA9003773.1 hypothetical protein [Thermomonospora cellulosilytica]
MITQRNVELAPPMLRRALANLAKSWPVGTADRHPNGWTGRVSVDENAVAGWPYDLTGGPDAHALTLTGVPVVCVTATIGGVPVTAWYRTSVLSRLVAERQIAVRPGPAGKPAAKPRVARVRTRRSAR